MPVLRTRAGFASARSPSITARAQFGHSKYGVSRIVKGFLDLLTVKFLTGYGQRPQHVLGTLALDRCSFGIGAFGYLAILWVVSRLTPMDDVHLHDRALLYYAWGGLVIGGQLSSIGLLAELITAYHARDADTYSIAERTLGPSTRRDAQHDGSHG